MSLILIDIYLCLIFVVLSFAAEGCDKTKCPGPLKFYEEIKCKPIYKNSEDCCAVKYDCSHLKDRSPNECYVNDNVYKINEPLKKEDAQPCDIDCVCELGYRGIASFECAEIDCDFEEILQEGCYLDHSADKCCPVGVICPEHPVTCYVDGKTFNEGEYFQPKHQPNTSCYCKPGYEGKNVEPFCHTPESNVCGTELRDGYAIKQNCAPVYYYQQSPQSSCSTYYRCQNKNDIVISLTESEKDLIEDESNTCKFGNVTMQIGDELNQATDYSSVCVKCKCEVPPILTCQQLSNDECDIRDHPKF